jgi:D-amino-acid dehydrogenase
VAPLAGPGVLSKLPSWLLKPHSPVRFTPSANPEQWRWCMQFMLACTRKRSDLSTRQLLSLSFLSRALIHRLIADEPGFDFDFTRSGKLVLHRDASAMQQAVALLEFQRSLGCEQEALDANQCVALEPALAGVRAQIAGGIHTASEDTADCHRFCQNLEALLRRRGVQFELGTTIDALRAGTQGRVQAYSGRQLFAAEQIVVASGTGAARLLKPLDVRVPVYPLKGYSLTYALGPESTAPRLSVTDFARKIVYARLGERLRVAGMADLDGYSTALNPARLGTLRAETAALFPMTTGEQSAALEWTGLRPATPRGTPIIGRTLYRNLWVNVGHGALGFTLAMGAAKLLADSIAGQPDALLADSFALRH